MRKSRGAAALLGAATVMVGALAGCGGGTSTAGSDAAATGASRPAAEAAAAPVALHLGQGDYSVSVPQTTISGTVAKGASVSVNGTAAPVHGGHWHYRLHLRIGSNPVEVEASTSGGTPTRRTIQIVRHHSASELEALARARSLRAEAKARHEAEARERKEREALAKREREQAQQQAECPNGTYENSAGNIVCKPYESPTQPAGATAQCEDGTYSFSESRSGTCSHHGGVAVWLNE